MSNAPVTTMPSASAVSETLVIASDWFSFAFAHGASFVFRLLPFLYERRRRDFSSLLSVSSPSTSSLSLAATGAVRASCPRLDSKKQQNAIPANAIPRARVTFEYMGAIKKNCPHRCKPFHYIFAMLIARQVATRLAYLSTDSRLALDVKRWAMKVRC